MSKKDNCYNNVRPPDNIKKESLIDNEANEIFANEEDFLRYKFMITQNRKIPPEIKTAMIASKREEMVKMKNNGHVFLTNQKNFFDDYSFKNNTDDIDDITFNKSIENNQETNISRKETYNILIELIYNYHSKFNEYCDVESLIQSIFQYSEKIIDEILLESDVCWGIRQNIEIFLHENVSIKEKLKKIFVPYSIEEYYNFENSINSQKKILDLQEIEKINKQIEIQNELEKQELLKKKNRRR